MSPLKWGCCALGSDDDAFTRCTQCKKVFHYDCLQTQDLRGDGDVPGWKCPQCKKMKRGNNDNVPIRPVEFASSDHTSHKSKKRAAPSITPEKKAAAPLNETEVRNIFKEIMKEERAELIAELKKNMMTPITTEIRSIKDEITCFKQSMEFISAQYEEMKEECKVNREDIVKLQVDHSGLQASVSQIDSRLNQLEQHVRLRNVELQCIPEKQNENLMAIVTKLSEAIGCDSIKESNIERVTRIAKMNRLNDRPRSIIVQFDTQKSKDNFLASAIKHNKTKPGDKLNSTHVGLSGERKPIYVMEHLSAASKSLHAATRIKAKALGYKFVWVRDGRIFVRKTEESSFIVIHSPGSLDKLV